MGLLSRIKQFFRRKSPVLGLALGSGGAKGMAHLGALKAFEEEGVSFSVVSGASIGAIVGALYAKGYSSKDMVAIVEGLNRREFAKNLKLFSDLGFAETFLDQYLEGDFSVLKLPFAAWVTAGDTNEGLAIREGKLSRALTASAAIPPFFRAVEIGGKKYYDGAFTNAVPADVCREMGADVVVGIDLAAVVTPDEEKGMFARLFDTAVSYARPVRYTDDCRTRGYTAADVMLCPDLKGLRATDIDPGSMNAMYDAGYRAAKEHMEEVRAAVKEATRRVRKHPKA